MDDPKARYLASQRNDLMRWLLPAFVGAISGVVSAAIVCYVVLTLQSNGREELSQKLNIVQDQLAKNASDISTANKAEGELRNSFDKLSKEITPLKEGKFGLITCDNVACSGTILLGDGVGITAVRPGSLYVGKAAKEDKTGVIISDVSPSPGPSITISDTDGNDRAVLGVAALTNTQVGGSTCTPESTLTLFKKDGKLLAQYP